MIRAHILLLQASPSLRVRLSQELEELGHTVLLDDTEAHTNPQRPQIILIDDHMLAENGAEWCTEIKRRPGMETVSIILLTSEDQVKKFDFTTAIDDFILAPLNTIELVARLKKILVSQRIAPPVSSIQIDELLIDPERHEVSVAGNVIQLTRREFDLLWFLAAHRGAAFSRASLLERVWKYRFDNGSRTIDIHVRRLRKKLGDPYGKYLKTVPRVGYKLAETSA
jgi:DNA-binding response OmpR family regulator